MAGGSRARLEGDSGKWLGGVGNRGAELMLKEGSQGQDFQGNLVYSLGEEGGLGHTRQGWFWDPGLPCRLRWTDLWEGAKRVDYTWRYFPAPLSEELCQ